MTTQQIIPMIVVDAVETVRDFYIGVLGATPTMEVPGYLQVRLGDAEHGPEVAFMTEGNAPVADVASLPRFGGKGVVLSVAVADVDAEHARLVDAGATPAAAPQDRPWGWRSFLLTDPSGLVLDFFTPVPQPAAV